MSDHPRYSKNRSSDADAQDPAAPERHFTIGELAEAFGLTTRAIRFYESRGLISPQRKGTARSYSRRDRARLRLIQRGKNLGFSLEEIRDWLELYDSDPNHVTQAKALAARLEVAIEDLALKRADIERSLKELRELRQLTVNHLKTHAG